MKTSLACVQRAAHSTRSRVRHRDAREQEIAIHLRAPQSFELGELHLVVTAQHLANVGETERIHLHFVFTAKWR